MPISSFKKKIKITLRLSAFASKAVKFIQLQSKKNYEGIHPYTTQKTWLQNSKYFQKREGYARFSAKFCRKNRQE